MHVSVAKWTAKVTALHPSRQWRDWLTEPGSLTARLVARSHHFRVRRIRQAGGVVLPDAQQRLQLPRRVRVRQRDVVLECDGRPVVFAHTIVPRSATAADWPMFGNLGERSLGSTLFGDRRVRRGVLEYARLPLRHPLMRRVQATLGISGDVALFARRCLYRRRRGLLLVSEIFLPAVLDLALVANAA